MNPDRDALPDLEALASFALKREAFAATNDEHERRLLAALDHVERMRWLAPADLLTG